jgi:hypothetical protein
VRSALLVTHHILLSYAMVSKCPSVRQETLSHRSNAFPDKLSFLDDVMEGVESRLLPRHDSYRVDRFNFHMPEDQFFFGMRHSFFI